MSEEEHVPNQILGMLKQGTSEEDAHSAVHNAGGSILKTITNGRLTALLIQTANIDTTMTLLQATNFFESLQLNRISRHQA